MNKRILATLLSLPLFAAGSAHADDSSTQPGVKFSGYGTAALTTSSTDDAQFGRPNQSTGANHTPRFGVDSNLGLQANLSLNDTFSGIVQVLARKDGESYPGVDLAWAFAKAKITDNFSIRVGRMGLPVFMISDYRNVGYANTMLRPPSEVYAQVPFNSIDGADVTWTNSFGDTNLTAQLAVGGTTAIIATGPTTSAHLKGNSITALNLVAEHGPLTLRFGRADTTLTQNDAPTLNALLSGLRAAGAGYRFASLGALANELSVDKKKGSFTSLGMALDWNNVVLQSEFAKRKTDSYITDTTSWYLMGGYRIGQFLPYVSHSAVRIDDRPANTVPTACPAGYPAACTPTLRVLSAGVTSLGNASALGEQSTDTIGVRWDFYRSAALKVQIDRIHPKNGNGLFTNVDAGFKGPVTVGAVAVDFVF